MSTSENSYISSQDALNMIESFRHKFNEIRKEYQFQNKQHRSNKKNKQDGVNYGFIGVCEDFVSKKLKDYNDDYYTNDNNDENNDENNDHRFYDQVIYINEQGEKCFKLKKYTNDPEKNFQIDIDDTINDLNKLGFKILEYKTDRSAHHDKGQSCLCENKNFFDAKCLYNHYEFTINGSDDCDCGVILGIRNIVNIKTKEQYPFYCDLYCNNTSKYRLDIVKALLNSETYEDFYNKMYEPYNIIIHEVRKLFPDMKYKTLSSPIDDDGHHLLYLNDHFNVRIKTFAKIGSIKFAIVPFDGVIRLVPYKDLKENNTINSDEISGSLFKSSINLNNLQESVNSLYENINILVNDYKKTYDVDGLTVISNYDVNNFVNEFSENNNVKCPLLCYKKNNINYTVSYNPIRNTFSVGKDFFTKKTDSDDDYDDYDDNFELSDDEKNKILTYLKSNKKNTKYNCYNEFYEYLTNPTMIVEKLPIKYLSNTLTESTFKILHNMKVERENKLNTSLFSGYDGPKRTIQTDGDDKNDQINKTNQTNQEYNDDSIEYNSFCETRIHKFDFKIKVSDKKVYLGYYHKISNPKQLDCIVQNIPNIDFGIPFHGKKIDGYHFPIDIYTYKLGVESGNKPYVIIDVYHMNADEIDHTNRLYKIPDVFSEHIGKVYGTFAELLDMITMNK